MLVKSKRVLSQKQVDDAVAEPTVDDDTSNIATQGSGNDNDDDEKVTKISKQVRVMR